MSIKDSGMAAIHSTGGIPVMNPDVRKHFGSVVS